MRRGCKDDLASRILRVEKLDSHQPCVVGPRWSVAQGVQVSNMRAGQHGVQTGFSVRPGFRESRGPVPHQLISGRGPGMEN